MTKPSWVLRSCVLSLFVAVALVAESAVAQGTIRFGLDADTPMKIMAEDHPSPPLYLQILWAPQGAQGLTMWHPETSRETPAEWLAQNPEWSVLPAFRVTSPGPMDLPAPVDNGTTIQVIMLGWTGAPLSFEYAYSARDYVGSAWGPQHIDVGDGKRYPADYYSYRAPLYLWQVPEPSTISLAGLGAALLLWRREGTTSPRARNARRPRGRCTYPASLMSLLRVFAANLRTAAARPRVHSESRYAIKSLSFSGVRCEVAPCLSSAFRLPKTSSNVAAEPSCR